MKFSIFVYVLSCSLFIARNDAFAQASDDVVSSDDIASALAQPKTRGLRGVGVRAKARVDLHIPFQLNSSHLAPDAERQLEQLSDALSNESLAGYRFEIAGHTDASGAEDYNRRLSERRAESVKQFLINKGVSPDRLESAGYGADELLLTDNPQHPDNRRVEIRNLGGSSEQ